MSTAPVCPYVSDGETTFRIDKNGALVIEVPRDCLFLAKEDLPTLRDFLVDHLASKGQSNP